MFVQSAVEWSLRVGSLLFLNKLVNKLLCSLGNQMGNRASLCQCINCWYWVQKGVETGRRVDPKYGVAHMKVWTERGL